MRMEIGPPAFLASRWCLLPLNTVVENKHKKPTLAKNCRISFCFKLVIRAIHASYKVDFSYFEFD